MVIIYDLSDPGAWEAARRHRNLWGKLYTRVYYLEEDVVVLAFHPSPDARWRPWEDVRMGWILDDLVEVEGRAA